MTKKIIQQAEAILRLQEETSVQQLQALLHGADIESVLPILRRLNELFEDQDTEVLLSLALHSFHHGEDDDAFSFISKAKLLEPSNQQVLRVALFFSMCVGEGDPQEICTRLLSLYPEDHWAASMQKKFEAGNSDSLSLPPLPTKWEKVIRGEPIA